jgi:MFS family permease
VPDLETHLHRFDLVGVALSGVGLLLLVYGIQEGQTYQWGTIVGPISVWTLIVAGLLVLGAFIWWQARNTGEPLLSLALFRDRNFSLGNAGIATVGFTVTAMAFPLMFYAQGVLGLSPTGAALLMAPMAVVSGALAPLAGKLTDKLHPRFTAGFGMLGMTLCLLWLALLIKPDTPIWLLLVAFALMGVCSPFVWAPIGSTATRNLPPQHAGAGSGVYNTTRQLGAVLGSAAIGVLLQSRLLANLPAVPGGTNPEVVVTHLPPAMHDGFATAMGQALLLPALVAFLGFLAVISFATPKHLAARS